MKESYYLERKTPSYWGEGKKYLKIGSLTIGERFQLITYPRLDIIVFDDWLDYIYNPNYKIISKDGTHLDPDEMLELITQPHASDLKMADINLPWVLGHGGNFDWVDYKYPHYTWSHECPIESNRGCC